MKRFKDFLIEDAVATAGNSNGMGAVVAANPSSTPGDVGSGTMGSGDIGHRAFEPFEKPRLKLKKKKKKKKKLENLDSFFDYNDNIDNFTAKYYDNYDDEDMSKHLNDINEDFVDKVTYEMSGKPPQYFWKHKEDFVNDMKNWGYSHTTLTKNTNMLIVTDKNLKTGKCEKAIKYNIPIYSYEDAFNKKENLYKKIIRKKRLNNLVDKYNL